MFQVRPSFHLFGSTCMGLFQSKCDMTAWLIFMIKAWDEYECCCLPSHDTLGANKRKIKDSDYVLLRNNQAVAVRGRLLL